MAEEMSKALRQEAVRKHDKIVITEMEEFVVGLQFNGETRKPEAQDVFADEDGDAVPSGTSAKDDASALAVIKQEAGIGDQAKKDGEEGAIKQDDVLHEAAVGKGLAGALRFLKDQRTLDEGGDRTTDKKKSKPVGTKDGPREIRIERIDEFGRVMTMKEAFRELSHKFHDKGPGKTKQKKWQRKYQDELKTK